MPPAVAAAAVTAAGTLGGAVFQSRAQNNALRSQERSTDKAMAYEQAQQWQARADARAQWDQYMRAQYGDAYKPVTAAPAGVPAAAPVAVVPGAGFGATPMPGTGAPLASAPLPVAVDVPPLAGTPAAQPQTLADLGGWSAGNFNRYLGRR